jgi:hypothetical protein
VDAARSVILAGGTMSPVGTHPIIVPTACSTGVRLYQSTLCAPADFNHITSLESKLADAESPIVPRGPQSSELNFKVSNMENRTQVTVSHLRTSVIPDAHAHNVQYS